MSKPSTVVSYNEDSGIKGHGFSRLQDGYQELMCLNTHVFPLRNSCCPSESQMIVSSRTLKQNIKLRTTWFTFLASLSHSTETSFLNHIHKQRSGISACCFNVSTSYLHHNKVCWPCFGRRFDGHLALSTNTSTHIQLNKWFKVSKWLLENRSDLASTRRLLRISFTPHLLCRAKKGSATSLSTL